MNWQKIFSLTCPIFSISGVCLISLLIFADMALPAQGWTIRHYTVEDGLPHNVGFGILQDDEGYLWIGTDNGLSRFDGKEFRNYGEKDSLTAPYIINLSKGPAGEIYASSYKKGVFKFENNQFNRTSLGLSPNHKGQLVHPSMYFFKDEYFMIDNRDDLNSACLSYNKNGIEKKIWVKHKQGKLIFEPIETQEGFGTYKNLANFEYDLSVDLIYIHAYISPAGRMFWSTNLGLYEYLGDGGFKFLQKGNFGRIDGNDQGQIVVAERGNIWLWEEGKSFRQLTQHEGRPVDHVVINNEGLVLWFLKNKKQLNYLNINDGSRGNLDKELNCKAVFSQIEVDNNDNFWITSHGEGLYHISPSLFREITFEKDDNFQDVKTIAEDGNQGFWIGTENGLFFSDAEKNWRFERPTNLPTTLVEPIIYNLNYVGNPNSIFYQHLQINSYVGTFAADLIKNSVFQMASYNTDHSTFDNLGYAYFIMMNRIEIYSALGKIATYPFSEVYKRTYHKGFGDFLAKNTNDFWYASHLGVLRWKDSTRTIYTTDDGIPGVVTTDLAFDQDSNVWIATRQGIAKFQDGTFHPLPQNESLKGACEKITFDAEGALWVGGPQGVFRIKEGKVFHINTQLGLPANDVNDLFFDSQNRLWIGTIAGLTMVPTPEKLSFSPSPKILLTSWVTNDILQEDIPTQLKENDQVQLKFDLLDLSPSLDRFIDYRFKDDEKWISWNQRKFTFPALRPGTYQLQFRARSINSDWSERLRFPFEILAPIWQRWWFIVIMVLLFILLTAMIVRRRLRNIQKKAVAQNELNQQIAHLQLSSLQSQLNPHFMFNALNAIQYFILNQDEVAANDYLAKFARLMRLFLEASHERFISLSEELELLELYIELEQLRFDGKFDYNIQLSPDLNPDDLEIPSMMLQPYVENAINHGLRNKDGYGMLQLSFLEEGENIKIIIEDDGIGREKAKEIKEGQNQKRISRGMQLLADRLKILKEMGEVDIYVETKDLYDKNHQAKGTKVEIRLPI